MSTQRLQVSLGSVDYSSLNTEEDFRREARRLLPGALRKIGEKAAEVTWAKMEQSLRSTPGVRMSSSTSEKHKFVQDFAREYEQKASYSERKMFEDQIVEELRQHKAAKP